VADPDRLPAVIEGTVVERLVNARRQPVVPAWIRDDVTRRAAVRYGMIHAGHVTLFHAARLPKYTARTALHSPRGLGRVLRRVTWWALDRQAEPLLANLVITNDHRGYRTLKKDQSERVRARLIGAGIGAGMAAGGGAALALLGSGIEQAGAAALFVGVLGYIGRPLDRVWLDVPVVAAEARDLDPGMILEAFAALGLEGVNKAIRNGGRAVGFAHPVTRDGPGWRADIELPLGVTVGDIIDRRERLASGLRRPLGAVWPEPDHAEHAGRLLLWVGYQSMAKARQPDWPLLKAGQCSLFVPAPFGTDQRGRNVSLLLMYSNLLTGGLPGSGKTMATRVMLLAAALDPSAELRVWELAGKGDLSAMEQVAYRYGSGVDDQAIGDCVADLREVHAELERRAKVLSGLPRDLIPENKVTRELAARASLRLHPLVIAISECQELFTHPQFGKEAAELAVPVIKRGRALGVILLLDTQRPDAASLPSGVSANAGSRFCLRVMDDKANNMVLGAGMYAAGYRATAFTPQDLGIGFLVGAGPSPLVVRSYYIDAVAADKVAARARKLREAAGTLSGHAIGDTGDQEDVRVSLLADVAAVIGAGQRMWSETICGRLAELRPEMYGGWNQDQLARALAPYGVETGQQWASGRNRRGVEAADIRAAMAAGNGHASR
jgi:DNA segregation ATPase FtsK/SpoIIIE, S-DNA-T family